MFSESLKMNSKSSRPVSYHLDQRSVIEASDDNFKFSLYEYIDRPLLRKDTSDLAYIKDQCLQEDIDES